MAPVDIRYDVDSASDLLDLIAKDPAIADDAIKSKIYRFDKDDLVLVTKILTGALKITDVTKLDASFISANLK